MGTNTKEGGADGAEDWSNGGEGGDSGGACKRGQPWRDNLMMRRRRSEIIRIRRGPPKSLQEKSPIENLSGPLPVREPGGNLQSYSISISILYF